MKHLWYITYSVWKKLFWNKKSAFTLLETTKNQRYSFLLIFLQNLRKIKIWERVVGLSATTITVNWRRAIFQILYLLKKFIQPFEHNSFSLTSFTTVLRAFLLQPLYTNMPFINTFLTTDKTVAFVASN